ncbi:nitrogen fixation protein NifR [Staphylococcus aureus]|nr:nitrogen fixation protein NifR [Staphylococcus aureus]
MSSASFNSILALFCRIFKYKFGMNNKVVIKLSCVIGIKDINQSNNHYNAYWRGPNKEADEKSAYNNVQVGVRGPTKRNWIRNFYRQCKLGKNNKFKIQGVILICYYYDNLQNYMKNE